MSTSKFDSEAFLERLKRFGQRSQKITSTLPRTQFNLEYGSQLIRSSASPGANYIEALEALGKVEQECGELTAEGKEIVKILTSSIITLEKKNS